MQPRFELSDWSVLSRLLRAARRDGWQVAFLAARIEICHPGVAPGVVAMPAVLLREARRDGWQVARAAHAPALVLRHPAVFQRVDLLLVG